MTTIGKLDLGLKLTDWHTSAGKNSLSQWCSNGGTSTTSGTWDLSGGTWDLSGLIFFCIDLKADQVVAVENVSLPSH